MISTDERGYLDLEVIDVLDHVLGMRDLIARLHVFMETEVPNARDAARLHVNEDRQLIVAYPRHGEGLLGRVDQWMLTQNGPTTQVIVDVYEGSPGTPNLR